jgi:localization factor PodJL
MKFGVPWSANCLRPEARETAKEAARRSGMSLDDWLNVAIAQQAGQQGVQAPSKAGTNSKASGGASIDERLDALISRVEQLARNRPDADAPKRGSNEPDQRTSVARPTPPAMTPPAMPSLQLPTSVDRAVTEIAACQRAHNGHAVPLRQYPQTAMAVPAPMPAITLAPAPLSAPVLSSLEEQFHKLTDQIETLRTPGVEQAINMLRQELGKIGRMFKDAMPRRAIEAIERQIYELNGRIADGRQAGNDARTLGGIERSLAEVRDALRGLTPAENLVGYNDVVAELADELDRIVAQRDPATLTQLESAITTLREMATHIASNETVQALAAQVQALGAKIEANTGAGAYGNAVSHLKQRVAASSEAQAERGKNGATVAPRLEALLTSLADKIEHIQTLPGNDDAFGHLEGHIAQLMEKLAGLNDAVAGLEHKIDFISAQKDTAALVQLESAAATLREIATHMAADATVQGLAVQVQALGDEIGRMQSFAGNGDAFGHLEGRIIQLAEKVDAAESRLGHLEPIERGLADLLVHIEEMRTNKNAGTLHAEGVPGFDELKQDIARTQDALEAVQDTLSHVVDRLAMIEKDIRSAARPACTADNAAQFNQPFGKLAVCTVDDAPATAPSPAQAQPATRFSSLAARLSADPELPSDQPLEPGSGPPPKPADAAARIAASEAAIDGTQPDTGSGGKSSFIAAARRAAQAAVQQTGTRPPRPEPAEAYGSENPSPRAKIVKRVKSLFIAASIIAIVVGSIQIAGNVFNLGKSKTQIAEFPATQTGEAAAAKNDAAPEPSDGATTTTDSLVPPKLPATTPLTQPSGGSGTVNMAPQSLNQTPLMTQSLFDPPTIETKGDVTGSISQQSSENQASRPAAAPKHADTELPIAIGGSRLRSAAIAGDAAAAFEVAARFAEGRGVPTDMEEAAHWYERAASKGLAPAQFRYASLLEKGLGVKKDLMEARRLYRAAATKGNSKAMHNLAVLNAEGVDGKPDYGTAVQWFRKAAQRGIADSQYNLGVLCARGLGTAKSYAEAYKWFALAAAQGDKESAKKRDEIAAQLDESELATAEQAVKAFVAETQPPQAAVVPEPPGGWDHVTGAPPARAKTRSLGPLSLGTFQVGKR